MKKKLQNKSWVLALFVALFAISSANAANGAEQPKRDSVSRSVPIYFAFDVSKEFERVNAVELANLLYYIRKDGDAVVNIEGWADKVGSKAYNNRLSTERAITARKLLVEMGVDENRIECKGMGIDYETEEDFARRAIASVRTLADVEYTYTLDDYVLPDPDPTPDPKMESRIMAMPERGKFSLRTNLLYWLACGVNAGFEWNPAGSSLGILVNGGYAPLGGDHWEHSVGGWFVAPELRYYLGKDDRWFVGAQLLAGGYNYKLSDTGYQGTVIAGGLTGGYKITLTDTFDMDFSLGLGYGHLNYDEYYHVDDTNIRTARGCVKNTIMPIQAGVSLIWKIR